MAPRYFHAKCAFVKEPHETIHFASVPIKVKGKRARIIQPKNLDCRRVPYGFVGQALRCKKTNFRTLFPFDTQVCKLGIESCKSVLKKSRMENILDGYTADQVKYKWSKGEINALTLKKIRLPDFRIKEA